MELTSSLYTAHIEASEDHIVTLQTPSSDPALLNMQDLKRDKLDFKLRMVWMNFKFIAIFISLSPQVLADWQAKKHLKSNKMFLLLECQRFVWLSASYTTNTKIKILH